MFDQFGINAGFVEDLHAQYLQSPHSVDDYWRKFFDEQSLAPAQAPRASPLVQRSATPAFLRCRSAPERRPRRRYPRGPRRLECQDRRAGQ